MLRYSPDQIDADRRGSHKQLVPQCPARPTCGALAVPSQHRRPSTHLQQPSQPSTIRLSQCHQTGSDIGSDDINAIESSQDVAGVECALPSTRRKPLTSRHSNLLGTPPPSSQICKRKAYEESEVNQTGPQRKKRASFPWKTPNTPMPSPLQASTIQLPSPLTATRVLPSPNHAPSSSQPTPSRKPSSIHSQKTLLQGSPKGSHDTPLYRFPFGSYSGKTLLEVPGFYLSCLRIDQTMVDSMPGFAAALRLYDAGQPPIATLPLPSLSQPLQKTPKKNRAGQSTITPEDQNAVFSVYGSPVCRVPIQLWHA